VRGDVAASRDPQRIDGPEVAISIIVLFNLAISYPGLLLVPGPVAVPIGQASPNGPAVTALTAATASMRRPLALTERVRRQSQRL
jgi:hypothetical protein